MNEQLAMLIYFYLAAANIIAFCAMALDKHLAQRNVRRIPEAALILLAVIGGAPGAIIAMQAFRHKTRHPKFKLGLPVLLLLQIGITAAFWQYL